MNGGWRSAWWANLVAEDLKATFTAPGEPKPLLDYGPRPVESVRYSPGLAWESRRPLPAAGFEPEDFIEPLVRQLVQVMAEQEDARLALELEVELERLQREEPGVYAEVLKRYTLLRGYVEANRDALAADEPGGEL